MSSADKRGGNTPFNTTRKVIPPVASVVLVGLAVLVFFKMVKPASKKDQVKIVEK